VVLFNDKVRHKLKMLHERFVLVPIDDLRANKRIVDQRKECGHKIRRKYLKNDRQSSMYNMRRLLDLACDKGAGSWLTALPIQSI
jgi:hypothetical protein